ncbi:hypothetical protein DL764_000239 [Monosporascus ibericus]|uniref:Uncharacterized protein n=1 Tax=Monosporascus ibericus TaxID=155417 RepID=A0A4Q4TUE0_9PEZI|nr:hypothetical protein DL764_000239 [Monosporascus ibericus]
MAAAPLGWGAPYPFTHNYPVSRLPRIADAQSNKIQILIERLRRYKDIPQTSYIPLCLNAYNCRAPVRENHGLWTYVYHRIITIRAPGAALEPIRIPSPQPSAARVRRDFNTPWRNMMPMVVYPHVLPLPRGPADPRYRLAIFIHKHPEANSFKAVYYMTIFDRQRNTLTWHDTLIEPRGTRQADIQHYWANVASSFNYPWSPLTMSADDYRPVGWRRLTREQNFNQVLGREPDIQSGMHRAALPTLLVFLIRPMALARGGPGQDFSITNNVNMMLRLRIRAIGGRELLPFGPENSHLDTKQLFFA